MFEGFGESRPRRPAMGRLVVAAPQPAHPDVTELMRAAAAARFEARVVAPQSSLWNVGDPGIAEVAAELGPAGIPLVVAGHASGVTPAFGSYRAVRDAVGVIGLRGASTLPAGACRLHVAAGADVFSLARDWLDGIGRWRGPAAPGGEEIDAILSRALAGSPAPGDPDAATLLTEVASFHGDPRVIERCCARAGRESADPYLRSVAVVCIGSILSDRWYGISDSAKRVVFDLQHDAAARAANPAFEPALRDFWFNTAP